MAPRAPWVEDPKGWATTRLVQVTKILHGKFEKDANLLTYEEAAQATVELSHALCAVVADPGACEHLGSPSCWAALLCQLMASRRLEGWTVEDAATQDIWQLRNLWSFVREFQSERFSNEVVDANTTSNTLVGRGAVRGCSHWLANGAVSNRRQLRVDSLGDDASLRAKARTLHLLLEAEGREGFPCALLLLEPPAIRTFVGAAHGARLRKLEAVSRRWQQRTEAHARNHRVAADRIAAHRAAAATAVIAAAVETPLATTDASARSDSDETATNGEQEEEQGSTGAVAGCGAAAEVEEKVEEDLEEVVEEEEEPAACGSGGGGYSDFSDDEDAAFAAELWAAVPKASERPSEAAAPSSAAATAAPPVSLRVPASGTKVSRVPLGIWVHFALQRIVSRTQQQDGHACAQEPPWSVARSPHPPPALPAPHDSRLTTARYLSLPLAPPPIPAAPMMCSC